jgi:hypothetical protein
MCSQLKFTSKELNRMSKKCEKEEKAEREKIKKSLAKDNQDGKLHAWQSPLLLLPLLLHHFHASARDVHADD